MVVSYIPNTNLSEDSKQELVFVLRLLGMSQPHSLPRRQFVKSAAAAVFGFQIVPRHVIGGPGFIPPSEKVNLGCIGIGGQGGGDIRDLDDSGLANIVALCDVDLDYSAATIKKYPNAKLYRDYRELIDKQKDIDAQQTELRKLKEQFDTQRAMLKDDVRQQREMELAEKLNALKMRYVQDQQTLAVDEAKATKPILERMSRILQTMGRDQKWTLILEKNESSVLYSEASLDLTNELIRRYNAGEGKK